MTNIEELSKSGPEERLRQLGIDLPEYRPPRNSLVSCVRVGELLFVSGHGPAVFAGKPELKGKVGQHLDLDAGIEAARRCGLRLLATLRHELGSLDAVERIVKVFGMVNSAPGFTDQSKVVNGCSDLLLAVFGEAGRHARSAVGMAELPSNNPVEIELVAQARSTS